MRENIQLACGECKQRNYSTTRNKKTTPDKLVTKKYCPFCRRHTEHKQVK
ncbi:50S ribosomal protein L33 [bacterium]|nr:50S ribosomal protein L33 [candidate division CSSED10-310 bacterium]